MEITSARRMPNDPGSCDLQMVLMHLEDLAENVEAGSKSVYMELYSDGFTNLSLALRRIVRAGYEFGKGA